MATPSGYWKIWIATLLFFGGFYALLVPLPRYLAEIGLSDWQIGIVLGMFGVASLLGRPLSGVLVDRLGARRVLLAGAGALCLGALGVPATTDMLVLLGLRLLQAIGYVAFTTAGTALVVQLSAPEQRTQRLAIFGIAANVAITLTPAAISALLTILPLAAGFVITTGLSFLAAVLALQVRPGTQHTPEHSAGTWHLPRTVWVPVLIAGLFGASFAAFFQFAPILAERRGDLPAGWLYSTYGIGIISMRLMSGRLQLQNKHLRRLQATVCSLALGLGLIATAPPVPLLLLAVLIIAGSAGILHPIILAHHVALLPGRAGQATATFYIGFDLGIGLGSWLFGMLLQVAGLSGLYLGAALIVLLMLPLVAQLAQPVEYIQAKEAEVPS